MKIRHIISIFGLCAIVAGCGVRGSLETAPPMWGKAKQEYEAEKAKQEAEKAQKDAAKKEKTN